MLFSSIPFLFYFLPCVFVLYFLVPMRWKNTMLLLASLFFYAWGEPKFVVFMLASIVQGYVLARLVEKYRADRRRAKLFLTLSLVFSLGLLGYCKYADFFLSGFNALTGLHIPLLRVALPIGISFYTFQILSYVVDVYRGDVKAQRNFIDLAAVIVLKNDLLMTAQGGAECRSHTDIHSAVTAHHHKGNLAVRIFPALLALVKRLHNAA